jgi:lathosterol oxidase
VHKPHHLWKIPTPFAAYAFHPLVRHGLNTFISYYFVHVLFSFLISHWCFISQDGYLQALPYHLFPFIFPLHKGLYLGLFGFVMTWTVFIHDGAYFVSGSWINGAAHHTIHHLEFSYNYGQYFTLWCVILLIITFTMKFLDSSLFGPL